MYGSVNFLKTNYFPKDIRSIIGLSIFFLSNAQTIILFVDLLIVIFFNYIPEGFGGTESEHRF